MELGETEAIPKKPEERFYYNEAQLDFCIVDFWIWNQSDLIENRNRGILAEFIVQQALGIKSRTRLEWNAFDLITEHGIKIEVKSAAYIQAWSQKKISSINFSIEKTKSLLTDNNYSAESKRQADVYIFCLLHHQEQETLDPLKLEQWTFYIVPTNDLNDKFPNQKSISLSVLEKCVKKKCEYDQLKEFFEEIII